MQIGSGGDAVKRGGPAGRSTADIPLARRASIGPADSPRAPAREERDPFIFTVVKGDYVFMLPTQLCSPEDANETRADGTTVLMYAVGLRREHMVRSLLCAKADMTAQRPRDGATALQLARRHGYEDIVNALLEDMPPVETDNSRCRMFTGHESMGPRPALKGSSEASGSSAFQFIGDAREVSWSAFQGHVRRTCVIGTRWLINAHGNDPAPGDALHYLHFSSQQSVATNDVIELLVAEGVRTIDIRCCGAYRAAEIYLSQLRREPKWLRTHDRVDVHFHGDPGSPNLSELDCFEADLMLKDFANPGAPPMHEVMSLTTRTTVSFDPETGQGSMASGRTSSVDEIAQRLPLLSHAQRLQLVGNYMIKCCSLGWKTELRATIEKFPALADVNYKWSPKAWSMLAVAAYEGYFDIVRNLLKLQPARAQIDEARAAAQRAGHEDVVTLLNLHPTPPPVPDPALRPPFVPDSPFGPPFIR